MIIRPSIKILSLISLVLFLSGCEGFRAYKWVENNTLYSTRAPGVEIHVSQHLQEGTYDSKETIEEDSIGAHLLWIQNNHYLFWDKKGNQQLVIKISNLNEKRFYMHHLDFSSNPKFLTHGVKIMEGWSFDTATFVRAMPQQSFLVKIFGRNFGTQTQLILFYLEKIDSSWDNSNLVLSGEQKTFLEGFSKRAAESFTILPYSGIKPPEQRNKVIVSKQ